MDKLAYFRQLGYELGVQCALEDFSKTAAGIAAGPASFLEALKSSWKPGLVGAGLGGVGGTVLGPLLNPDDHNAALHGMLMGGLGGAGAGVGQHLGMFGGVKLFNPAKGEAVKLTPGGSPASNMRKIHKAQNAHVGEEVKRLIRYARSGQVAGGATGAATGIAAGHALGKKKTTQ